MGLLTILFFYLAFPSGGVPELAWFTLVPVLFVLNKLSLRNAFMLGLLAATLGWFVSIWWVIAGLAEITSSSANIMLPFVLLFCLLSALPYAVACWTHVRFKFGHSISGAFFSAIVFTVLVNYIPHILPGNLAHALYQQPIFIQLADIGGVALVFFIIHVINILIANGINFSTSNTTKATQCFGLACLLFLANMAYGSYKQHALLNYVDAPTKTIKIAMLQPNIDVSNRSRIDWKNAQATISQLLTQVNKEQGIDLIIFPEVPVPISFQHYQNDGLFFNRFLAETPLLLTAISPFDESTTQDVSYFNTMELIESNAVQQEYAKQVLLPFGEYLPYEQQFPWLRKVFPFAPNYKPGNTSTLFTLNNAQGESIQAIPLICYEAVFSEQIAAGVAQGGELMINTSNDAWFFQTAGRKVHLALSLFRSVEYRQYLVRATNTGLSAVINPYGQIVEGSEITADTQGYSVVDIPIEKHSSFYQMFPNFIKIIFILICFVFLIYARVKNVNR
ncbi:apolipoprotein N-acyltransferase [Thalassotalea piscium]